MMLGMMLIMPPSQTRQILLNDQERDNFDAMFQDDNTTQITLDQNTLIEQIRQARPDTQAIYLFGSYANGTANAESDLDVALLLPPVEAYTLPPAFWWTLQTELSDQLGLPVDLINLRQVNTVFQIEIIDTGRRIYCFHRPTCDDFEAITISLYHKLNDERAEILAAIRATGVIYG